MKDFDKGLFIVTMAEKSGVRLADLKKKTGSFEMKKVELTVTGTVTAGDEVEFGARESGMKAVLQNPEKAEKDVLAEVKRLVGEGKTLLKVSGELTEVKIEGKKDPKVVLVLSSVEVVEPKK